MGVVCLAAIARMTLTVLHFQSVYQIPVLRVDVVQVNSVA